MVELLVLVVIPPALRIDSKRRRRLQEKRMAMGHKRDDRHIAAEHTTHVEEQLHDRIGCHSIL